MLLIRKEGKKEVETKPSKKESERVMPNSQGKERGRAEILSQDCWQEVRLCRMQHDEQKQPQLRWGALSRYRSEENTDSCRALVKCQIDLELKSRERSRG